MLDRLPNRRSHHKLVKRALASFIHRTSFRDWEQAETVCRVSRSELIDFSITYMKQQVHEGPVELAIIPQVEKGLVLADSRGRGAFQQ